MNMVLHRKRALDTKQVLVGMKQVRPILSYQICQFQQKLLVAE
nr:MAG TPA: hypothetical protein [Caudoviricetes sp.]